VGPAGEEGGRIGPITLGADGAGACFIQADQQERLIHMKGHETFREAVRRLSGSTLEVAAMSGLRLDEIDLFVYHQANARILRAVAEKLELDSDRVIDCIDRYGNTSSATIPIALAEAVETGRLKSGDKVLLAAFGAGFAWGAGVIEWR
jgi:3-oxoacyl-[acyl-carrier-protein] synthase III